MLSIVVLAHSLNRRTSGWNLLSIAVLVLLGTEPRSLYALGFQLSVASVAGLLLLGGSSGSRPASSAVHVMARALLGLIGASVAATLATAPLVAWAWGRVPLAGLWLNPLVVPLLGLLTLPPLLLGAGMGVIHTELSEPLIRLAALPATFGQALVQWGWDGGRCPSLAWTPTGGTVGLLYCVVGLVLWKTTSSPLRRIG
jgi:competence protein ComEC